MGNTHHENVCEDKKSSIKHRDEYISLITTEENNQLKEIFQSLSISNTHFNSSGTSLTPYDSTPTNEKMIVSATFHQFQLKNFPLFEGILRKQGFFSDIQTFRKYIVLFTRTTSSTAITTLWNMLESVKDSNSSNDPYWTMRSFMTVIYDMAIEERLENTTIIPQIHKIIDFIKDKIQLSNESISLDRFIEWSNEYAPFLYKILETFFYRICWKDELNPSFKPFYLPLFGEGDKSSIISEIDLLPFAMYSDHLQGLWKRLYTSETDGLSFNRICHHILGYDGPTCILMKVRGTRNIVIGGFADERWKENNRFYGTFRDFVFAIEPSLKICRTRSDGNMAYRWLNTKSYSQPHGLGFGGTTEQFRLFIPESLESCIAQTTCLTYEAGKLLPDNKPGENYFEIDIIEIWACGGEGIVDVGLKSQVTHRGQQQVNINRARKVDKAAFFNNSFDQEFLLSNTLQHRSNGNDRLGS